MWCTESHIVGRDHIDPCSRGEQSQRIVARRVDRVAVIPQFDGDVLVAEHIDQAFKLA
jgi:hypothetical protein